MSNGWTKMREYISKWPELREMRTRTDINVFRIDPGYFYLFVWNFHVLNYLLNSFRRWNLRWQKKKKMTMKCEFNPKHNSHTRIRTFSAHGKIKQPK